VRETRLQQAIGFSLEDFIYKSKPMKTLATDNLGNHFIAEVNRGSVCPAVHEQIEFTVAVLMSGQVLGEISIIDATRDPRRSKNHKKSFR
jgi:hypothetical protein